MNMIIKKLLCILPIISVSGTLQAMQNSTTPILYSVSMPSTPFQQPYYQMMIKGDTANQLVTFSTSINKTQLPAVQQAPTETLEWNSTTCVGSDYAVFYRSSNNVPSIIFGMTPYQWQGYFEGSATTLYAQRPAQVTLPFIPQGGASLTATLPDYAAVLQSQESNIVLKSLTGCTRNNCAVSSQSSTLPSWVAYYPCIQGGTPAGGDCANTVNTYGALVIIYGSIAALGTDKNQKTGLGAYYTSGKNYSPQNCAWGNSIGNAGLFLEADNLIDNNTFPPRVVGGGNYNTHWSGYGSAPLCFAPVLSPGYNGSGLSTIGTNNNGIATVLPQGDLAGNYSAAFNPYVSTQTATYDGITIPSMSYFQLFAANMPWYYIGSDGNRYVSPGQGIFSDALQMAAMEAVPQQNQNVTSAVFIGSSGVSSGVTGPQLVSGTATNGGTTTGFSVPEAFLSKVTSQSFMSGTYLQKPSSSQTTTTTVWAGGLVAAVYENPLEYYGQGALPYLPLYFADPGVSMAAPGWNYCSSADFTNGQSQENFTAQMYRSDATNPMTDFSTALAGTR